MLVLLGKICFVLLAVIGMFAICQKILKQLAHRRSSGIMTVFLSVHGHDEEIEYRLRTLISQSVWSDSDLHNYQIVCLDYHMDPETKFICQAISRRYPFVKICAPEKALELLKN